MHSPTLVALTLAGLASATPTSYWPAKKSCGSLSTQSCANVTAAQGPIEVRDEEYVTNTFQWYNWPTVLTWKDCSNTCDKTEGCKSFSYNYAPDDGLVIAGVSCVLYYHTVESYTVPCSDNDNTPLETFFDKDCYPPARQTSGTVPAHPSTDDVNGTCDAARPLKNQHTFIGDQLGRGVTNSTQAQCGEGCKRQLDCKSYYFANYTTGPYYKEPYDVNQHNYPTGSTDISTARSPGLCIYLSQPVSEVTVDTFAFVDAFYDKNCPY